MSEEIPKSHGPGNQGPINICCHVECNQKAIATAMIENPHGDGWHTYAVCMDHFDILLTAIIPGNPNKCEDC